MVFLILLLLALDLRVFASYYGEHHTNSNNVKVVDYNEMGGGECPKIKEPLCATNGREFVYFENKCFLEVTNYQRLLQGQEEYIECELDLCNNQCPPCGAVYDPVCAVEQLTGQRENFVNQCEVERRICKTKKEWKVQHRGQCTAYNNKAVINNENPECPELCTLEYKPICAKFLSLEKEFSNECELKTTICQTKQKWDIVRHGPCVERKNNKALQFTIKINNCPKICPLDYRPICAKFQNEIREFNNKCELEIMICQKEEDWDIINNGPCPSSRNSLSVSNTLSPALKAKCPQACTLEYNPICAQFQNEVREFGNICALESIKCEREEDWQIINNGPCVTSESSLNIQPTFLPPKPECPKACTLEYNPICAQFQNEIREFSNKCALDSFSCENKQDWLIINNGPCSSDQGGLNIPKLPPPTLKPKCPQACTLEYNPICAQFQNEVREFGNKCALESIKCEREEDWKIINNGPCVPNQNNLNIQPISLPLKPKCPKACTLEYRPICAQFKNQVREFSNNCALESFACENEQDWQIINNGPCSSIQKGLGISKSVSPSLKPKCPQACTLEYNPICAQFQNEVREFGNKCALESIKCEREEDWQIINNGPCVPSQNDLKIQPISFPPKPKCPKACTLEYKPICAQYQNQIKEFSNKCSLESFSCENEQDWQIINKGPCSIIHRVLSISKALTSPLKPKCPHACTLEYQPICAKYQGEIREFGNKCALESVKCETEQDWQIINHGPCFASPSNLKLEATSTKPLCLQACTKDYKPVCAKFQNEVREFSNKCVLENFICDTQQEWQIINDGQCSSTPRTLSVSKAFTLPTKPKCPLICTADYRPICAKYKNQLKEFANSCILESTICHTGENWEIVHQGKCSAEPSIRISSAKAFLSTPKPKCPQFCILEYKPICAKFDNELREFSNNCDLQRTICQSEEEWEVVNEGPCTSDAATANSECPKFCTDDYNPVCAEYKGEQKEFPNKCELLSTICETQEKWEVIKLGSCPSTSRALLTSQLSTCPQFCTRDYKPVCAKLNNKFRTFSNKCELQRLNCETEKDWTIVHLGICSSDLECPIFCTREYLPVCAKYESELREFPNKCELKRTNCETDKSWEIVNLGKCSSNLDDSCPEACTEEYRPVCAEFEGALKEFGNKCDFKRTVCQSKQDWKLLSEGPCPVNIKLRKLCPQACTKEFNPVCASFKGEQREFSNNCEFKRIACETNEDWQLVNEGPCPAIKHLRTFCPQFCSKEFNPVCARFKGEVREFPNHCEFQRSICESNIDWELINNGPCLIKAEKPLTALAVELQPLCASNGKIHRMFQDLRDLQEEIQKTGVDWSIIHNENCQIQNSCNSEDLDPICAIFEMKQRTFNNICQLSEEIKSSGNEWTILHKGICETISTTTSPPTSNPLIRIPLLKLANERLASAIESISTTTTPKSTTTKYTRYIPISSSTTSVPAQDESLEMLNISKGYKEIVSHCGDDSYEDSEESLDDEDDNSESWEDEEDEEDDGNQQYNKDSNGKDSYKIENDLKGSHDKEYQSEKDDNNKYNEKQTYIHKESNPKTETPKVNKDGKNLMKLIQEKIWDLFGIRKLADSNTGKYNNKPSQDQVNTVAYSSENKETSEDCNKDISSTSDESLNAKISYEEEKSPAPSYAPSSQQVNQNYDIVKENKDYGENKESGPIYLSSSQQEIQSNEAAVPQENEFKFGVYSDDAYDIIENKPSESELSATSDHCLDLAEEKAYKSANKYQDNLESKYHPSPENNPVNSENVIDVFEALLDKSNDDEVNEGEALFRQVLTTSSSGTTSSYPVYEETEDNQLNYTKREEYPSKYNSTANRKGEIYNGVVYKAPVYDAPTYNFIYTAPNHPILPLTPNNNRFLNYPQNIANANPHNPLLPVINQTNPSENLPPANLPFNPMDFLSKLAAMSSQFVAATPNLLPIPPTKEYDTNPSPNHPIQQDNSNNPYVMANNQPNLVLQHPFAPQNFNPNSPQTHSPLQVYPSLPPEQPQQLLSNLVPFNIANPQRGLYEQNSPNKVQSNLLPSEFKNTHLPYHPFPATLPTDFQTANNPHQSKPPLLPPVLDASVPLAPVPQQPQNPPSLYHQSPNSSFNATVFNQIVETLKTITNRS